MVTSPVDLVLLVIVASVRTATFVQLEADLVNEGVADVITEILLTIVPFRPMAVPILVLVAEAFLIVNEEQWAPFWPKHRS